MDSIGRFAAAIRGKANREAGKQLSRRPVVYGRWMGAESVDPDLSKVYVAGGGLDGEGELFRFIPRLAHVTGLTTSSTVLCLGSPLCIIGIVVGDITLASV